MISKDQIFLLFLLLTLSAAAQKKEIPTDNFQSFHRVSVALAHSYINNSIDANGNTKWLSAGSWGLNYYYKFHPAISFGLQLHVIMQDLKIKENDASTPQDFTVRSYPLTVCPVICYQPARNINVMLGSGTEYCNQGPLFVTILGIEYNRDIYKNYYVGLGATYSVKWKVYDTYLVSFIIGRKFLTEK